MFLIPAALAALVLSGGVLSSLTGTGRIITWGLGLKLLTSSGYRGREGFLTPTISVSMNDPEDATGMFIVSLARLFPELKPFVVKNGLPVRWVLTAPLVGKKHEGEARTLKAILDPLVVTLTGVTDDNDAIERVRHFRLLPPLIDFLEQLPDSRITTEQV